MLLSKNPINMTGEELQAEKQRLQKKLEELDLTAKNGDADWWAIESLRWHLSKDLATKMLDAVNRRIAELAKK